MVPFSGNDYHLIATHHFHRGLCNRLPPKFVYSSNSNHLDIDSICNVIHEADIWYEVTGFQEMMNECIECFNLVITGIIDLLIPVKDCRVKQ